MRRCIVLAAALAACCCLRAADADKVTVGEGEAAKTYELKTVEGAKAYIDAYADNVQSDREFKAHEEKALKTIRMRGEKTLYDDFKIEGATLADGGFENGKGWNVPATVNSLVTSIVLPLSVRVVPSPTVSLFQRVFATVITGKCGAVGSRIRTSSVSIGRRAGVQLSALDQSESVLPVHLITSPTGMGSMKDHFWLPPRSLLEKAVTALPEDAFEFVTLTCRMSVFALTSRFSNHSAPSAPHSSTGFSSVPRTVSSPPALMLVFPASPGVKTMRLPGSVHSSPANVSAPVTQASPAPTNFKQLPTSAVNEAPFPVTTDKTRVTVHVVPAKRRSPAFFSTKIAPNGSFASGMRLATSSV